MFDPKFASAHELFLSLRILALNVPYSIATAIFILGDALVSTASAVSSRTVICLTQPTGPDIIMHMPIVSKVVCPLLAFSRTVLILL